MRCGLRTRLCPRLTYVLLGCPSGLWAVEAFVEVPIGAVNLVGEHGAERAAVCRKTPVAFVHVFAVGYRSGDGLVGVAGYARLDAGSVPPARCRAPVSKR